MEVPADGSARVHGDAGGHDHGHGAGGVDHAPGLAPGPDVLCVRGDRLAEHLDDVRGRVVGREGGQRRPRQRPRCNPPNTR